MENYFFLENYVTSEGAVSHNVLHHQPLPITRHQEWFYAKNYLELLPIVSTSFKKDAKIELKIALQTFILHTIKGKIAPHSPTGNQPQFR